MSSALAARVTAALGGEAARLAILVRLDFASGTMRLWEGVGELTTSHPAYGVETWTGHGGLVGVSEADLAAGFFASTLTVSLSGVPDRFENFYRLAMQQEIEVHGRRIVVAAQVFDAAWQPLGSHFAYWAGTMDRLLFDRAGTLKSVSCQCETPFVSRRKPRLGFLTDEDQQQLFPGDRGLRFASVSAEKQLTWPQY